MVEVASRCAAAASSRISWNSEPLRVALSLKATSSDSHIVSHLGRCATKFERDIHNIDELVDALRGDAFEAISWR